jgi:hypothetical protein
VRAEAAVRAEYDAGDDRGHWHAIERSVERLPQTAAQHRAVPGPALIVESVPHVHGAALVVAAQQVNVLRVPGLERQQESDHLHNVYVTKALQLCAHDGKIIRTKALRYDIMDRNSCRFFFFVFYICMTYFDVGKSMIPKNTFIGTLICTRILYKRYAKKIIDVKSSINDTG